MQVGTVVSGKYRLVRLLGDGGMGSVFEAHHERLGTRVAIKFLHPDLARRTGLGDRFLQEARVAAQIKSPHVVHVTDIDTTPEGEAYIVMELLEGEPLSTVLERDHKLGVAVSCDYTRQILEALEAAHALGVIHRDLKPENVFVTFTAGRPVLKLIDFGIAKLRRPDLATKNLTVAGVLMGTAEYMAPEQAFSADKVDARSDVYSVGVMLYEMIAGQRPVSGEDARVIALKVERGEVTPLVHVAPDAPREIAGLVHRAIAARPELRFQSAAEMRIALEQVLSGKRPATAQLAAVPGPLGAVPGPLGAVPGPLGAVPGPLGAVPGPLGAGGGLASGDHAPPAGTGTVMGAPAEALLTGALPARAPGGGVAYGAPATSALSGGTARVAPVESALLVPHETSTPRRGRTNAWLIVALLLVAVGAVGAIIASQYDVLGGGDTPAPPAAAAPAAPPATTPAAPATATPTAPAAPTDPLAPLVTPPPRPPAPAPPRPRPSASAAPSSAPAPSATVPALPTIPPFPIPLPPMPSGSGPIVLPPFPSAIPLPPIPGFGPPVTPTSPAPSPSGAPSAGY